MSKAEVVSNRNMKKMPFFFSFGLFVVLLEVLYWVFGFFVAGCFCKNTNAENFGRAFKQIDFPDIQIYCLIK